MPNDPSDPRWAAIHAAAADAKLAATVPVAAPVVAPMAAPVVAPVAVLHSSDAATGLLHEVEVGLESLVHKIEGN